MKTMFRIVGRNIRKVSVYETLEEATKALKGERGFRLRNFKIEEGTLLPDRFICDAGGEATYQLESNFFKTKAGAKRALGKKIRADIAQEKRRYRENMRNFQRVLRAVKR